MAPYQLVNLTISSLAFAWTMGLIVRAWFARDNVGHIITWQDRRPRLTGAGWAFTLWCAWWLSLALIYIFLSQAVHLLVILFASDLGNLMILGASIAYCRANAFRLLDLLPLALLIIIIPVSEMTVAMLLKGPAGRLVAISPSAVLATAAMVSLGWAVLVRCGWRSAPFFFMMCVYAVLQLPAYVYSMAFDPSLAPAMFDPNSHVLATFNDMRKSFFDGLQMVFYVLAGLKVVIALSFWGYFLSPSHRADALSESQAWPSEETVPMHETYAKLLKWGAGVVGSLTVGLLLPAVQPNVLAFIKNHLPGGN